MLAGLARPALVARGSSSQSSHEMGKISTIIGTRTTWDRPHVGRDEASADGSEVSHQLQSAFTAELLGGMI